MKYRYRTSTLFPLLLMLLLAALTFWLERTVKFPDIQLERVKRHDPDFIVDRFNVIQLNKQGTQQYRLSAQRMVHYLDDDSTFLEQPKLDQTEPGSPPLHLSAKQGTITSDGEELFFNEEVFALREAGADEEEMTLATTYMHVIPNKDIAKTDRPVTITQGKSILRGIGMEINKETRAFKLLSNVKADYEPRKNND